MTDDLSTPSSWAENVTVNESDAFPSASTTPVTMDAPDARLYSSVAAPSRSDVLGDLGDLSDIEILDYLPTAFEREHFDEGNFMPDRPCTAYFIARERLITKDIFDALARDGIPARKVRCIQRKLDNEIHITFTDKAVREKFVKVTSFSVQRNSYYVRSASRPHTFLTIYDAPHEMPDAALIARLRPYCNVIHCRRGKLYDQPKVCNGLRHFRVVLKKPVPCFIRFGKFLVRFYHDNQPKTCRRCNSSEHLAKDCDAVVCYNCDGIGHVSKACPNDKACCICRGLDHLANDCDYSWHRHAKTDGDVSVSNDDHPSDDDYYPKSDADDDATVDENNDGDDEDDDMQTADSDSLADVSEHQQPVSSATPAAVLPVTTAVVSSVSTAPSTSTSSTPAQRVVSNVSTQLDVFSGTSSAGISRGTPVPSSLPEVSADGSTAPRLLNSQGLLATTPGFSPATRFKSSSLPSVFSPSASGDLSGSASNVESARAASGSSQPLSGSLSQKLSSKSSGRRKPAPFSNSQVGTTRKPTAPVKVSTPRRSAQSSQSSQLSRSHEPMDTSGIGARKRSSSSVESGIARKSAPS